MPVGNLGGFFWLSSCRETPNPWSFPLSPLATGAAPSAESPENMTRPCFLGCVAGSWVTRDAVQGGTDPESARYSPADGMGSSLCLLRGLQGRMTSLESL